MTRPRVELRCVADHYAGPNERIVEFSWTGEDGELRGGLLGLQGVNGPDGSWLNVSLYRLDPGVSVKTLIEERVGGSVEEVPMQ